MRQAAVDGGDDLRSSMCVLRSVRIEGLRRFLHPVDGDSGLGELAGRYAVASALTGAALDRLSSAGRTPGAIMYTTLSRGILESDSADDARLSAAIDALVTELAIIAPWLKLVIVEQRVDRLVLGKTGSSDLLRQLNAPGHKDRTDFSTDGVESDELNALAQAFDIGHDITPRSIPLAKEAMLRAMASGVPCRGHPYWTSRLADPAMSDMAWLRIDASGFLDLVTDGGQASWRDACVRSADLQRWFEEVPSALLESEADRAPRDRTLVLHSLSDDIVLICPRERATHIAKQLASSFADVGGDLRAGVAPINGANGVAAISRCAHRALEDRSIL